MEVTRIAPTPSGFLHVGNAINFLLTAQLARHHQARLRLRIDDLDADRMRPDYLTDIFDSLRWLGISWQDGPQDEADHRASGSQRTRLARYEELLSALAATGRLYACGCSRSQRAQEKGIHRCRVERQPLDVPDAAWRLAVEPGTRVRLPVLHGPERVVDLAEVMEDPVLRQRNGHPAYQIASLADDVDHGTTFIVRGEDLLASSACQMHLAELLGLNAFLRVRMVHHALVCDADGRKLSKSEGASSLKAMRERGEGPEDLVRQAGMRFEQLVAG